MAEAVDLKKWYVVRAVSGQENKIRDYMESEINRLGFDNMVEDILVLGDRVEVDVDHSGVVGIGIGF